MSSHFLRLLLVLGCLVAAARSTCNVCHSVNKMACYSMTQLKACDANNLPSGAPLDCPAGYMCASGSDGVLCQPKASPGSVAADCQECNKCDASQTFACTGRSSFSLCLGTNEPHEGARGNCAVGYVCNNGIKEICELATTVNPSCTVADTTTTTTTTTTTVAPPTNDASAYCATLKKSGNFAVGEFTETTCRQYIKCYFSAGRWQGKKYNCSPLYFDRNSGLCVTSKPSYCYTPITIPTTTTVAPTTADPAAYCAKLQTQDYFPVGTNPSTTCRQYIHCFIVGGSWLGKMYTCPGKLYYNSATKTCVSTLPATCSDRIASLSINGIELE